MQPIPAERYYAEIEASTAGLAALVDGADLGIPIPTCPEWSLRQLATHVGRAHRWAAQIAATRSAEFIPFRSVPDGRFPDDPGEHAAWLNAGARRVIDAVREAGSDRVWAFGNLVPAGFWARRMTHETLVHKADADLATGRPPAIEADIAADAIDEWLELLATGQEPAARPLPDGVVLHVHTTDGQAAGEWLVRQEPSGLSVETGHGRGDVALTGPAARVLLVLLGRLPADDPAVTGYGDVGLLTGWLAGTPF
jgi:uncharacterized protein (TIGR03083 family)